MKYKVGEKVVLRDDVGLSIVRGKAVKIEWLDKPKKTYGTIPKHGKGIRYSFFENSIDHEKTAELNKDSTIRHYLSELEGRVTAGYTEPDAIEPSHYRNGEVDLIESWYLTMPFDGFRWAMKSHIDKYVYRYEEKNGIEDLDKAIEFIERLKEKEAEHARD